MASWILPKNEQWGIFQYIKLPQRSFFGRIQDNIIFFQNFLTLVMGYLDGAKCTLQLISTLTSHDEIKCFKAKE